VKELATTIIGIMLALALVIFTGLGKVPIEVFCSLVGLALGYFFKTKEQSIAKWLKKAPHFKAGG
jgi:uncharacterized membrane protein